MEYVFFLFLFLVVFLLPPPRAFFSSCTGMCVAVAKHVFWFIENVCAWCPTQCASVCVLLVLVLVSNASFICEPFCWMVHFQPGQSGVIGRVHCFSLMRFCIFISTHPGHRPGTWLHSYCRSKLALVPTPPHPTPPRPAPPPPFCVPNCAGV